MAEPLQDMLLTHGRRVLIHCSAAPGPANPYLVQEQ